MSDAVEDTGDLRDFLYVLLFICASTGHQVRHLQVPLNRDAAEMGATFTLIKESISLLTGAAQIFPQYLREQIAAVIQEQVMPGAMEKIEVVGD